MRALRAAAFVVVALSLAGCGNSSVEPGANAVKLSFTVQPSNGNAGVILTPSVQVVAQDASGNTVTGYTSPITIALSNNPTGDTLMGNTIITATAGVATFSNLFLERVGTG